MFKVLFIQYIRFGPSNAFSQSESSLESLGDAFVQVWISVGPIRKLVRK